MRFFIDDVEVIFPYSYIYPEQAQYMHMLKRTLDQRRLDPEGGDQPVHVGGNGGQPGAHALLEMPSGTGKTVTLLSFLVSYQAHYPLTTPTIVYCTRTIPEVEKTLHELRTLMAYRAEILREEGGDPLQTVGHPAHAAARARLQAALGQPEEAGDALPEADALPIGAPATLGRFTAVGLTSRRNLCIHPKVVAAGIAAAGAASAAAGAQDQVAVAAAAPAAVVDARCASRVAPWVRRRHAQWEARRRTQPPPIEGEPTRDIEEEPPSCVYYENLAALAEAGQAHPGPGVHSLEDLLTKGRERRACPYYTARGMIAHASIIVHSYAYLIDPRASAPVTSQLPSSAIVVLDEAHNLDSSCTGVLSVDITRETLDRSVEAITALETRVSEVERVDRKRLEDEYDSLIRGLRATDDNPVVATSRDFTLTNDAPGVGVTPAPTLAADVPSGPMPGNIRKARHFLGTLLRLLEYLKTRLVLSDVLIETPGQFIETLTSSIRTERRSLRFVHSRLTSLIRALEMPVSHSGAIAHLERVASFATLAATYESGFSLVFEPGGFMLGGSAALLRRTGGATANSVFAGLPGMPPTGAAAHDNRAPGWDTVLHFSCLDPSIAMQPIFRRFSSVILTSGTLTPLGMYESILGFRAVVTDSFGATLPRECFLPMVVTRGSDQLTVSTQHSKRHDRAVIANFGKLLLDIARCVPDGIAAFFPSYGYMEHVLSEWNRHDVLGALLATTKLIFVETPCPAETAQALANYRLACDNGRGAILLAVARGKVSEGIDLDNHYGRAVIVFGVPFLHTESPVTKERLAFLRQERQISEREFLTFDAVRQAAQCVGRAIRGKTDYGLMIFADYRYDDDKRRRLPRWINSAFHRDSVNMSTDMAVTMAKRFVRAMAQPYDRNTEVEKSLWTGQKAQAFFSSNSQPGSQASRLKGASSASSDQQQSSRKRPHSSIAAEQ